ncbi:hypothetical protein JZ751_003812, partial [Albula glossodonta]
TRTWNRLAEGVECDYHGDWAAESLVVQEGCRHPRERPREDDTKMKNRLSSSHVNSKKKPWSWDQYLDEERAIAAPMRAFTEYQSFPNNRNGFKVGMKLEGIDPLHPSMFCVLSVAETVATSKFQVGMKLEAVDRKNPCLVCVATIADIVDNRFLVHFDNWDDTYDYW